MTLAAGGRTGYRSPDAPVPDVPAPAEHVEASISEHNSKNVILSAIDPRFDQRLLDVMRQGTEQVPLYVPALSRVSRNLDKLFRVLEFLLAHHATMLTTNYMLRSQDVWVRRKRFVRPDDDDLLAGLEDTRGLGGAHREVATQAAAALTAER